MYDLGPDFVNPSLTEQGTKCGEGKVRIHSFLLNFVPSTSEVNMVRLQLKLI